MAIKPDGYPPFWGALHEIRRYLDEWGDGRLSPEVLDELVATAERQVRADERKRMTE